MQLKQSDIHLVNMKINKLRLKDKKSYLVIEYTKFDDKNDLLNKIANKLETGIEIIELNCTNANLKELIPDAKKIRELCSIYNVLYIVNDRIDIAQITEADGIFLEENSIDIENAKRLLNENSIIGTAYHSKGSDYIALTDTIELNPNNNETFYFVRKKL